MPTVSEIKGARANAGIRWLVPAKVAVFIAMLFPLARLVVLGMTGGLGANPIEFITRSTGLWTLVYLCITLAITPVRRMTGITALARFRRMIGLYAFFFAVLHFTTYIWFDKWFDVAAMLLDDLQIAGEVHLHELIQFPGLDLLGKFRIAGNVEKEHGDVGGMLLELLRVRIFLEKLLDRFRHEFRHLALELLEQREALPRFLQVL